jgi:hypothetical protein
VRNSKGRRRGRVGKVSFYLHHGGWWLYFREGGKPVRRKVASTREEAEKVASQPSDHAAADPQKFAPVERRANRVGVRGPHAVTSDDRIYPTHSRRNKQVAPTSWAQVHSNLLGVASATV